MHLTLKFVEESAELPSNVDARTLSNLRQRQVQDYAQRIGLRPSEFEPRRVFSPNTNGRVFPALYHKPTTFYFVFGGTTYGRSRATRADESEQFESWFCPGTNHPDETSTHKTWPEQLDCCQGWLRRLKEETAVKNLWSDLADFPQLGETAWEQDNQPISAEERTRIDTALEQIEARLIAEGQLSAEDRILVREELADLRVKTQLLGKRDWSRYALGIFIFIGQGILRAIGGEFFRWAWPLVKAAVAGDTPKIID